VNPGDFKSEWRIGLKGDKDSQAGQWAMPGLVWRKDVTQEQYEKYVQACRLAAAQIKENPSGGHLTLDEFSSTLGAIFAEMQDA
jgi:hypothetical protein